MSVARALRKSAPADYACAVTSPDRRHGFVHLSPFGRKFFNDLEMILVEDALRNDLRW